MCSPIVSKNRILFLLLIVGLANSSKSFSQAIIPDWHFNMTSFGVVGGVLTQDNIYHFCHYNTDYYSNYAGYANMLSLDSSGNFISDIPIAYFTVLYLDNHLNTYGINWDNDSIYSYDSNGNIRWQLPFPVTFPCGTWIQQMLVDSKGNLYTIIEGRYCPDKLQVIISRIDSSGNLLWLFQPNPDSLSEDYLTGIVLNKEGDLFFTGYIDDGMSKEYYTIRINSDGSMLWKNVSDASLSAIAVDDSSNAYITGYTGDLGIITKFSLTGEEKWSVIDSNASGSDIALDKENNIVVQGSHGSGNESIPYLAKFDNSGNELWSSDFISLPDYDVSFYQLVADSSNNIVVIGEADDPMIYGTHYGYLTIKYSSTGNLQWYYLYEYNCGW